MASFTAGTTFVDGVSNDVTAAKLSALVNNATPTSGFIQDRTAETITATNDTLLIGDASDSNNLKRITVANFAQTLPTAKVTTGTIDTGTFGTTTSTAATITTGTIPTLTSITKITSGTGTAAAPAISPTGDTNTGIFFPTADTIAFAEGGAESMRIDSNGNVGIGTTSATSKLHISGTGSTASNPSTSGTLGATLALQGTTGVGNGGMLMFGATAGYYAAIKGYIQSGNNNTLGDLLFCVRNADTDTTLTEAMRIDASGQVGIGTTSPDYKLDVDGTVRINSAFASLALTDTTGGTTTGGFVRYISNGTSGAYSYQINTAAAGDFTTAINAYTISSAGNISIGTATALSKLHVHGDLTLSNATVSTTAATGGLTLPATAAGYLTVSINGTSRKIPYYA